MVEGNLLIPIPYEGFSLPLIAELPVNPELSPVLVSSTQGVLWVNDKDGVVRAAFREDLDEFFKSVILSSLEVGLEERWQNSNLFSELGLKDAIEFLKYYKIPEEYHLLIHPSRREESLSQAEALGVIVFEVPWMPSDRSVLVPRDRSYLGSLIQHKSGMFASVVHNISRGMFILKYEE